MNRSRNEVTKRRCIGCDTRKPLDPVHFPMDERGELVSVCRSCLRGQAKAEAAREYHGEPGPSHERAVEYSRAITQAGRDGTLRDLPPFSEWAS